LLIARSAALRPRPYAGALREPQDEQRWHQHCGNWAIRQYNKHRKISLTLPYLTCASIKTDLTQRRKPGRRAQDFRNAAAYFTTRRLILPAYSGNPDCNPQCRGLLAHAALGGHGADDMHQEPHAEANNARAAVLGRALGRLDAVLMSRLLQLGCGPPDLMASLHGPKAGKAASAC